MMFSDGPINGVVFRDLHRHDDHRGWLMELFRCDEFDVECAPRMAYITTTESGVVRGPHEHADQSDLMAFVGPGDVELYLWDARDDSSTRKHRIKVLVGDSNRQLILIPPGVVHAFRNNSPHAAVVYNFPNRLYAGEGKSFPVDEIRHEESPNPPYVLD